MNKREFIKSSLATLTASSLALTQAGCDKNDNTKTSQNSVINNLDSDDIIPKQTDVYKFSVPMLFDFSAIDSFVELNKTHKKSQITTLYNSIPWPLSEKYNEWFMLSRGGYNPDIKTYSDFEKYAKYAMDRGFKVVYLMNSPKVFNERDIKPFKKDFFKLLDNLWNSGIKDIKFSNTQVAQLINEHNPDFNLHTAVILEYSSIAQYENLFEFFPNIKHICVPKDQNQNFKLLKSLKKRFPKTEIELMVDEGCRKFCPVRFPCMCGYESKYKIGCNFSYKNKLLSIIMSGRIPPWIVEYYSAIGINDFKFVPRHLRSSDKETPHVKLYMNTVEYGMESEYGMKYVKAYIERHDSKLDSKLIVSLFPDIKYFVKYGHECHYKCGVECNYCFECAKKLENLLMNV